jgi:hypothetical protein
VLANDGSIVDFLDGKYSYLNEELAPYYGIKGVKGPEFRRVELDGTHRSGVLTQASVLRVAPRAHGPARFRVGEFRRHRPLAGTGRQVSHRPVGRTAGWQELSRTGRVSVANRDAFAQCLAEKVTIYALGRGLEPEDRLAIRTMAQHVAQNGHRIFERGVGNCQERAVSLQSFSKVFR